MSAGDLPAAGWFGKLPTLGDFAARGLDAGLVEFWDDWLSHGLQQLQQARPGDWLQTYLDCPSWCFVLLPGALPAPWGDQAHAGVLMPSVDRVGRYFPLTLWQSLGPGRWPATQWHTLWAHLARLNEIAVSAVHDDWAPQELDEQLARLGVPELTPSTLAIAGRSFPPATMVGLPAGTSAMDWLALETLDRGWDHSQGRSLWFSGIDPDRPLAMACDGLPVSAAELLEAAILGS